MTPRQHDPSNIETKRLAALKSYNVLDTLPEKEYDAITRLASYICQVPVALISLIDADRQWFKSKYGVDVGETSRADAFCNHTIHSNEILEVPDTLKDDHFKENIYVKEQHFRFYAGAPLIDPEGNRLGSLCVVDIKPRKLSPEQRDALCTLADEVMSHLTLRKQKAELEISLKIHQEFRDLFDSSPDIHCIMDREFRIEQISLPVKAILGYDPAEIIGQPIWNFFPEEEKVKSLTDLKLGLSKQQRKFKIEMPVITPSNDSKWVSWSVTFNDDQWFASGRDITFQKKVLGELELLSLVASSTTSGVVINNSEGKVEWVNRAFEQITGYNIGDLKNNHLGDVLKGELTDVSIIQKSRELSRNKQSFEVDLLVYRKDGQPLWISVINSVIINDKGEVDKYIEVIIDITAKKKTEIELIAAKEEALQLSRAKDMFISVMSHEIRTPLNAVIGMSHLLLEDDPQESQKENLNILKFSAENLMTLINDVLDFTKIETGNVELEKAPVDLREIIQSITGSMRYKADEKNIYLNKNIDDAVPAIVIGDRARLIQILLNLVGNAIKFTDKGGVNIDLKVIQQSKNDVRIRFAVADTGIGIVANKLNTIFEQFKQADIDITRKYGGTGLGLPISKRLIELHDSRINVDSLIGHGSTFWFTITFKKADNQLNRNNTNVEEGLRINVLVVDDNQINRLLINKILKKWGANADFAENGLEAVNKIESNRNYNVVLMDIHMPEMGGLEATQVIRSKAEAYFQQLPIIALTASLLSDQMGEISKAGMNDYILKPFDPKLLYDKLSRYQQQ